MSIRPVKKIYPAYQDDIADLHTVRPLPSPQLQMIDPFLLLNHHGPQVYKEKNRGLPFGPHPHRGFQTVTFIIEGDIAHKDSGGHESIIDAGGIQWMSAGRGLVHEEVSSTNFKQNGGPLEILQLWINLPARLKMSDPYYVGLQRDQIPVVEKNGAKLQVIAGEVDGVTGPFKPSTDISIQTIELAKGARLDLQIAAKRNVFFYVVRGAIKVNDAEVAKTNLVEFAGQGDMLKIEALREGAYILLCHAEPYGEPVAFGGPFVMNTEAEVRQAYDDFRSGKF